MTGTETVGETATDARRRRDARTAQIAFSIATLGGIAAAVAYWTDRTELPLGLGLAAALGGIGTGLIAWAKSLGVDERAEQEREPLCVSAAADDVLDDEAATTHATLGRRPLLGALLGTSLGALLVGVVGPLGSLGPKPRGERDRTGWTAGRRLVTIEGRPIRHDEGRLDQLVTVFPDGELGRDDSQVVLLRLDPDILTPTTRDAGAIEGWVAYSKICTHAGCSVGLFGIDSRAPDVVRQLVCPCHQSVFDPVDAARPVGGPAPRPLPQLPLGVDAEGYLIALADFGRPVGPITWDEG